MFYIIVISFESDFLLSQYVNTNIFICPQVSFLLRPNYWTLTSSITLNAPVHLKICLYSSVFDEVVIMHSDCLTHIFCSRPSIAFAVHYIGTSINIELRVYTFPVWVSRVGSNDVSEYAMSMSQRHWMTKLKALYRIVSCKFLEDWVALPHIKTITDFSTEKTGLHSLVYQV